MLKLSPTEERRVRIAAVVGVREAHVVASILSKVNRLSDRKHERFMKSFRKATRRENKFHHWLKLQVRKLAKTDLYEIDEQIVREQIFRSFRPYLHEP
jgi:uncharacterized protein YceH (UPF0502 family)